MSVIQAASRPDRSAPARWSGRLGKAVPDRRALSILVGAQLLTGVVAGLIWLAWAPSTVSYLLDAGDGTGIVVPAESESQVAGDGRYVLLTAVAGLVFGLLAWRLRASRGRITLTVLAISSLLASLVALGTGELLSGEHLPTRLNTAFHPQLVLHASAAVFGQALVAVLLYTVLVGLSSDQQLGREASSGGPEPAAVAPAAAAPGGPGGIGAAVAGSVVAGPVAAWPVETGAATTNAATTRAVEDQPASAEDGQPDRLS